MADIYIDKNLELAVEFDGKIRAIADLEDSILNNIYRARVDKIVKNQKISFLSLIDQEGFMNLRLDDDLKENDEILVQVKKLAREEKYAELSRELSLEGEYIIYFISGMGEIKFSKKLARDARESLNNFAKEKNLSSVLFRSKSENLDKQAILREYKEFQNIGEDIKKQVNLRPTPKLLYRPSSLDSFLKGHSFSKIICNDKELVDKLKDTYQVEYNKEFNLLYKLDFINDYKNLFEEEVKLDCGGNIVIESTKALTSIDVNAADFKNKKDRENFILEVNIAAASEVYRQISLRNISGIIIVDFINMKSENSKRKLINFLKKEFRKDYTSTKILGYTRLGLVEISRKSLGRPLENKLNICEDKDESIRKNQSLK